MLSPKAEAIWLYLYFLVSCFTEFHNSSGIILSDFVRVIRHRKNWALTLSRVIIEDDNPDAVSMILSPPIQNNHEF
jgi:hypothetical protein